MPPHPCSGAGNAAQISELTFGSQKDVAGTSRGLLSDKSLNGERGESSESAWALLELVRGLFEPRGSWDFGFRRM